MPDTSSSSNLKKIECDPMCGFMVRSHVDKELIDIVKGHVKNIHKQDLTDAQVKEKIKPAN